MPKYTLDNIGHVLRTFYVTGIIDHVSTSDDTASVIISGQLYNDVPIYYHCSQSSTVRENGALQGSALAFSSGNEVIVLVELSGEDKTYKVVAHTDGRVPCSTIIIAVLFNNQNNVIECVAEYNLPIDSYVIKYAILDGDTWRWLTEEELPLMYLHYPWLLEDISYRFTSRCYPYYVYSSGETGHDPLTSSTIVDDNVTARLTSGYWNGLI